MRQNFLFPIISVLHSRSFSRCGLRTMLGIPWIILFDNPSMPEGFRTVLSANSHLCRSRCELERSGVFREKFDLFLPPNRDICKLHCAPVLKRCTNGDGSTLLQIFKITLRHAAVDHVE